MAIPDYANYRISVMGPSLSRAWEELAIHLGAVQANSAYYTSANYTTMVDNLSNAVDAIIAATTANYDSGNPSGA